MDRSTFAGILPYQGAVRALLFTCVAVVAFSASAQERYGIAHSNFGGTDIAYLNPARTAGQWPYADIRIAGADAFAWNSLVAWSDRDQSLVGELRDRSTSTTPGRVVLRSSDLARTHRATVQAAVLGPAVSLALGRGTIGLGIRSRAHVSASGVSEELGNFIYQGFNYAPQVGVRYRDQGVRVLGAAWTEFSANYAHIIRAEGFSFISVGVGIRYNLGHSAGAFQFTDLDYTVVDTAQLIIHEATARYGVAQPAVRAGSGWGADLGMVYERTLDEADGYFPHQGASGCTPIRYRYRIGVSLIDLGGIRFRNAEAGTISAGSLTIPDHEHIPVQGVSDLDSLLSTTTQWSRSTEFAIGLPTAISLQYDQRIVDHAYIAFAAVQNLAGRSSLRLRRANSLAITPRFETRYFEAALPVVLHEYAITRPSIGFMLRLNGLVIGSDHILPFVSKADVYALDVYARLRIMLFRSPACKGKRSSKKHRSGSKDMVPCVFPK